MSSKFKFWIRTSFRVMEIGSSDIIYNIKNNTPLITHEKIYEKINECHIAVGHSGRDKTWAEVKSRFSGIPQQAVSLFINICDACQIRRSFPKTPCGKPIISIGFLTRLQVDLIDMRSVQYNGFTFIMHVKDHFTKFSWLFSLPTKEARHVALNLKYIFYTFGPPKILQSDNGKEFVTNIILNPKLDWPDLIIINARPRHPQSQGLVERANAFVKKILGKWLETNNSLDWPSGLGPVMLAINNCTSQSTKKKHRMNWSLVNVLMGHGIKNLDEILLNKNLNSINFHSNEIERINGLQGLINLTHLDLSSNNITRIQGLESLISLTTLNLSSNKIVVVEGLFSLKKLTWLNLSYNKIEYLQGFQDLWGNEFNLNIIQIHGNHIDSLDDVIKYMNGLSRLEHLTLRENPISKICDYRLKLFNHLRRLTSLDGLDKHGNKHINSQPLNGIEQYIHLSNQTKNQLIDSSNSLSDQYPKIAAALNSFRYNPREFQSSTTSTANDIHNESCSELDNDSISHHRKKDVKETRKRLLTDDKHSVESQLSDIETDSRNNKNSQSNLKTNHKQSTPRQKSTRNKNHSSLSNICSNELIEEQTGRFSINYDRNLLNPRRERDCDEFNENNKFYLSISNELDSERNKRYQAEQQIKQLNLIINQLKQKGSKTNENLLEELNDKHKQLLNDEKSKFRDLTSIVDDYKKRLQTTEDQLCSYKKAQETNLQLIKTLENNLTKSDTENHQIKINQNEKVKRLEDENHKVKYENDSLEKELSRIKEQLRQCQELCTNKDIQHKQEVDKCRIDLQSNEVQFYIKQEIQRKEDFFQNQSKIQQEKLESLALEYKKLENEFRDALKIEQRRYIELLKTNEIIRQENELFQSSSANTKQNQESDKKIMNDLMMLVREQKTRLQEKSKINENVLNENKNLKMKLEKAVEELRKIREQILLLQKERKEINSRFQAHESILSALKEEKKLWTQELTHQGVSLAQDRGRLESTIEILNSEISTLKKQLDKQVDTSKIKQTIIESQLDTIQKLKDGIVERDETIKKTREEFLLDKKEFEKQIQEEQMVNQELQDKYDNACEKKDSLKSNFNLLQQELEKTKSDYNALTKKWKEKSDLINELDNKIRRASETYQINEKKLSDENNRLMQIQKELEAKVHERDDDFRRQFEVIEHGHRQTINEIKKSYEDKLEQSQSRINQIEDEMRLILNETNQQKLKWQQRIKHLNHFINDLQQNN
ncbi:unnamed protein product [Rotaria socialis]|uniref:Integrase catalytic domain-containing protein n=1 Tax=Rotaria socialis TaxID=392032 RepID=A0A820LXE5_9BILA|nr:unnamed protein product [Rotaria socialis]